MKKIKSCKKSLAVLIAAILMVSCASTSKRGRRQYTYLELTAITADSIPKQHIELNNREKAATENGLYRTDDRDVISFLGYNKTVKRLIVKEYLRFKGNKVLSDKTLGFNVGSINNRYNMLVKNLTFTVEVEALYSVSLMLLGPNVKMVPVLINKRNGMVCNNDQKAINEIYKIYTQWYRLQEKEDFKKITWPLTGSDYQWMGEVEQMNLVARL